MIPLHAAGSPRALLTSPRRYGLHPYGVASLATKNLKELQDYDVTVSLSLPRSPPNLERGNFMVALYLLDGPPPMVMFPSPPAPPDPHGHFRGRRVLHASTRPALIPYTDPLVSLASRVLFLLYHVLFPGSERADLAVPMAERLRFRRTADVPASLYLELQAGQALQVYEASVTLTARLRGLRWFMYRHRIVAFVTLTTAFWLCEVTFTVLAWVAVSSVFGGSTEEGGGPGKTSKGLRIKQEGEGTEDLSDTPRTFPTQGRQPPLKYEPRVKEESVEREASAEFPPPAGAEADDEDEDDGHATWRDSGIGTSYSDTGPGGIRRRPSRGGRAS